MLQTIEANLVRSTQRVSGELCISQSNVVRHLYDLGKNIRMFRFIPHEMNYIFNKISYSDPLPKCFIKPKNRKRAIISKNDFSLFCPKTQMSMNTSYPPSQ